jgi:hypothetical protein
MQPGPSDSTDALFRAARDWLARYYPGRLVRRLHLELDDGDRVRLPVPIGQAAASAPTVCSLPAEGFVPTPFQQEILDALEGRALRTEGLASAVGCDRRSLFRKPGGISELQEHGYVKTHKRMGYYRPDSPPEEIFQESQ